MRKKSEGLSLSTLLVLVLVAVLPVAVATGFSNFERARHVVLAAIAAMALVAWAVGLWRQKGVKVFSPGTVALGGAFLLATVASLAWSSIALFGALSVISWVGLGIVFLILLAPVGRAPEFSEWATAVAIGTIGAGSLGLYELFGGAAHLTVWQPAGVAGGFDSIGFASAYYIVSIPVLIAAAGATRGWAQRASWAAMALAIVNLTLCADQLMGAVFFGAVIVAGLLCWGLGKGRVTKSPAIVGGLLAVCLLAIALGPMVQERPTSETDAVDLPRIAHSRDFSEELAGDDQVRWSYFAIDRIESPLDHRFRPYLNTVTRGLWEKEPLLGHGAGGWAQMQTDVVHVGDEEVNGLFFHYAAFRSPHSDYSRVLVEQGALGFLLFLLFLAGVLTAFLNGLREGLKSEEETLQSWALLTTFLTGAGLMVFVPVLELASSAVVWTGATALGVVLLSRQGSEKRWLKPYHFLKDQRVAPIGLSVATVAVAVAMVGPAVVHGQSALDRGHADHLMLRSYFSEAIPYYESAHQRYPAHAEVLYNLALAHALLSNSQEGYEAAMKAVEMRPYDSRFLSHAALISVVSDRVDQSLRLSKEAVRTGPNNMRAYDIYAVGLQRRGRNQDTLAVIESALEKHPPAEYRADLHLRIGIHYEDINDDVDNALKHYKSAVKLMQPGPERELAIYRLTELEKRIERTKLQEQGLPVPRHLMAEEPHHHHGHPGHHHGPGHGQDDGHDHDHGHDHGPVRIPDVPGLPDERQHYHR